MCKYESLLDGTLSLYDIALMNNYIDCVEWNNQEAQRLANQH